MQISQTRTMYTRKKRIIRLSSAAFVSSSLVFTLLSSVSAFQVEKEARKFKNAVEPLAPREIMLPQIEPRTKKLLKNDGRDLPALIIKDDDRFLPCSSFISMNSDHQDKETLEKFLPAALPLSKSISTQEEIPVTRKLQRRRLWGVDDDPAEYWFHNQIHSFGNIGFFGMFHALMAPIATTIIDNAAYDGQDVRMMISSYLNDLVCKKNARVLDLCCGVGISTRALHNAFSDAEIVLGLDTSKEMLTMAKLFRNRDDTVNKMKVKLQDLLKDKKKKRAESENKINFAVGNAERTIFPKKSFDLVTIM